MRKDQIYPSKYLKAPDLRGRDVTVTIENVEQVALQGKPSILVYFRGKEKALVVKPAIFDQIELATGCPDTDDWEGKSITLFPTETLFAGQTYEVIRVRTKQVAPRTTPRPEEPPDEAPDDFDDTEPPF